jgi:hypothetical protein
MIFYSHQPQSTALLSKIIGKSHKKLPDPEVYHLLTTSEHCLCFNGELLEDQERVQWIQERGGYPVIDPKNNPFDHAVFWFSTPRAKHYAQITAEGYLAEPEKLGTGGGFLKFLFRR